MARTAHRPFPSLSPLTTHTSITPQLQATESTVQASLITTFQARFILLPHPQSLQLPQLPQQNPKHSFPQLQSLLHQSLLHQSLLQSPLFPTTQSLLLYLTTQARPRRISLRNTAQRMKATLQPSATAYLRHL